MRTEEGGGKETERKLEYLEREREISDKCENDS